MHLPRRHLPHRHLPHLHLTAALLTFLYAAAVAVALTAPGEHRLAGAVVLTGLVARWALRHRHRAAAADVLPAPVGTSPA